MDCSDHCPLVEPHAQPVTLPSHFQGEHLHCVQLVATSQIFPLNCYQENLCLMNFCFITLLKQIRSRKTCGKSTSVKRYVYHSIPLSLSLSPSLSLSLPLSLSLNLPLNKKQKKCQLLTHCVFQRSVLFSPLLLTMDRSVRLQISKALKPR